jgi:rubredoxin
MDDNGTMTEQRNGHWKCLSCGHVYDPGLGAPEDGIAPGTPFADLPAGWTCPECGTHKGNFAPIYGN